MMTSTTVKSSVLIVEFNRDFTETSATALVYQKTTMVVCFSFGVYFVRFLEFCCRYSSLGVTIDQRMAIGRMCKDLVDLGRLDYLSKNGFAETVWFNYISDDVTPENVLLVAKS